MIYRFGEHQLDDQRLTLTGRDGAIHLEPQVFRLLHHLLVHRERVVPKEELLDEIWGDRFVSESALTSRVKTARQAVGDDGATQQVIKTVHGRGYHFVADVSTEAEATAPPRLRLRTDPIGRTADIDAVVGRVRSSPVVTVTGPGGIGKTTVALAAVEVLEPEVGDSVIVVDLSLVPPGGDITRVVADAAGLDGDAAASLEGVGAHLAGRSLLLVLDNCEHVLDGTAQLVEQVVQRGAATRVLATSREPIGAAGEHVWPLGPLGDDGPHLFVERARAAEPRLEWSADDPQVAELCARLDNVPLALELAAGQLRRFGLDEVVENLARHLVLMGRRAPDGDRHQSVETTVDWSYRLLDPVEQCVLRHLSVFPTSFDLHAAAAVMPASVTSDVVVRAVGELVDKSLVVRSVDSARYRLLEMIRVFAAQRLDEAEESDAAVEAHRVQVVRRIASTSRVERWMSGRLAAAYRADLADIRAAFRRSLERQAVDDAVEVAVGGSFLWRNALGWVEGEEWVRELRGHELAPQDRLWLELLRADIGEGRGDHVQLFDAGRSALDLSRDVDDPVAAALAAHFASLPHLTDPGAGRPHLVAALDAATLAGDPRLVTLAELFVSVCDIAADDRSSARSALERLEGGASEDGYDRFILHWTGWMLALVERDADASWRWMDAQQDYLDRTGVVETWWTSFSSSFCEGVSGGAVTPVLVRTMVLADREGYDASADCVLSLAYAEMCADRFEAAAELMGTAVRSRFNATAHYVLYRVVLEGLLRANLGAAARDAAVSRGRARTSHEVLAEHGITV